MEFDSKWKPSDMTYRVIEATEDHRDWIINHASVRMLEDELKRPDLVNKERLSFLVDKVLEENTMFVAVDNDGLPVGALAYLQVDNLYNPCVKTLAELFWYVDVEVRKTRVGLLLLKAFKEVSEKEGKEAMMSLLPSSNVNFKSLERLGFSLCEYGFRLGE